MSKDLKHMQAMVETSELRPAECNKMIQTIPAKYLKPYRISQETFPAGTAETKPIFTNMIIYSIEKTDS